MSPLIETYDTDPLDPGDNVHLDAFGQEINKGDYVVISLDWIATEGKVTFHKVVRASSKYKMIKIETLKTKKPKHVYANTVYRPTPEQITYLTLKGTA
jgi:hypothetical protein